MFYVKLAFSNLRKNRAAYLPFSISMLFLVALNTLTQILIQNKGMKELPESAAAIIMFNFGWIIILIFTVIFSLYTNSFLLKQRKNELGLYSVLGLGKRELYQVLFFETIINFVFVISSGIVVGAVLAKLGFLVLRKLMNLQTAFTFQLSLYAIGLTVVIFAAIFCLLFFVNCFQVARMKPIDLLRSGQTGEKMPKTRWISTILGVVFIGVGYFLALKIKSPIEALSTFFTAVVLVILGTYCLFAAASITGLKFLKNRPSYYYQTNHFINVSSMIYRMKQNAAGLASICILSTMVLVTIVTTASLYFGQQGIIEARFPRDVTIQNNQDMVKIQQVTQQVLAKNNATLTRALTFKASQPQWLETTSNGFRPLKTGQSLTELSKASLVHFISRDEYQKISQDHMTLTPQQVIVVGLVKPFKQTTVQLGNQKYEVKKQVSQLTGFTDTPGMTAEYVIVMDQWSTIETQLARLHTGSKKTLAEDSQPISSFTFDFKTTAQTSRLQLVKQLENHVGKLIAPDNYLYQFSSKDSYRESSQSFMGGFFFLGIIFGMTFTLATALIIYYKQVSEGLQDKERFVILQKVGLSHQEVKKIIHSQILTIFAFPLLVAIIHLCVALPMICKLLYLFDLTNKQLILQTTGIVVIIFATLYFLVYQLTARGYYKIVER